MTCRTLGLLGSLYLLAGVAQAQGRDQFDSLTTAAQVQWWMRQQGYREFVLTDSVDQECYRLTGDLRACLPAGASAGWLKADFDGNGRPDLLVTGYRSSESHHRRVLCLLDQGGQRVREVRLLDAVYDCTTPQLCFVGNRAAIRYAHLVTTGPRFATTPQVICRVDTLVFNKTDFVEYNHAPRDYQIQRVAFGTTSCLGSCPVVDLQLDQGGAAVYRAGRYAGKQGRFTATVPAAQVAELWRLLNYLDFPRLNDYYHIGATDHPTATLTITYAGGKVKTSEDYGEQGTFGLQRAYELLFSLRTSQQWK